MVDHPWLIGSSLWKPRKAYADSRAFTDTPGVFKRGASAVSTWPVVYWPTLHSRIASTNIYVGLIYSEYVGASVTWRSAATCCRLQPYVLQAATLCAAGMAIDWARCCTERFKRSVLPLKVGACTYYGLVY